jgi:hypothetical protein
MTIPNTPTTSPITDFSDSDLQLLGQILFERYTRLVPIQSADAELQLDPQQETLTLCPSLYWEERGANFVVIKIGDNRFRCQFFYSDQEQFGTGREFYDNLGDCVVTMLQVQADHERAQKGVLSGMTAKELPKAVDDDYFGPLII